MKINNLEVNFNLLPYKENICNATSDLNNSSFKDDVLYNSKISIDIYIKNIDQFVFRYNTRGFSESYRFEQSFNL
jgi:hypothetical protein